jgi:glycine cleavage system regulatory protein
MLQKQKTHFLSLVSETCKTRIPKQEQQLLTEQMNLQTDGRRQIHTIRQHLEKYKHSV